MALSIPALASAIGAGTMLDKAATNLSFLTYLEGNLKAAERHADLAITIDHLNSKALVNRGNVHFAKSEWDKAKGLYLNALGLDPDCLQVRVCVSVCFIG